MQRFLAAGVTGLLVAATSAVALPRAADAQGVSVQFGFYPPPVYAPPPVYYAPPPAVVYAAPRPYYVAPAYGYGYGWRHERAREYRHEYREHHERWR